MSTSRETIIRTFLQELNVGALLLWRSEELVLAKGYLPLWGISVCLFPSTGTPILYIPELEPRDRLPEGVDIKTFPWGNLNCKDPWEVLYKMIKADLVNSNKSHHPLGFVPNAGQTSPAQMSGESAPFPSDFKTNLKRLSGSGFKDVTNEFLKLYQIKQPEEIKAIALSNKVAGMGIKTFYEHLKPGCTEAEVAGAVEMTIQNQMGKNGVLYAKAWPLVMSGINTAFGGTYNRTTGKSLQPGELVMIEMAVCVNGYWCDITRTGAVGTISKKLQDVYEVVKDAQQLALDAIKPGIKASEPDTVARNHINNKGYGAFYRHALGHHVGFRYHDPGPGLAPGSELVLKEGMILTVEPGIYGAALGGGCRIEDNVLVTSDGVKILSDFTRELR